MNTRRRRGKIQYLVHWKGYPDSENTWVDQKDLHAPEILNDFIHNSPSGGRKRI